MRMGFKLGPIIGVLLDKTTKFICIVNRSWGLNTSNGIIIQETKFEGKIGNHHFYILNTKTFVLSEIILNNEIVRRSSKTFGRLLRNQIKLIIIITNVFS
jgi:hypothetical protein